MPPGKLNRASAPLASVLPNCPALPATVVTTPAASIFRIVLLNVSATCKLPLASAAIPVGKLNSGAPSLLSLLESQHAGDVGLHAIDSGLIEFDMPKGRARCRLAELVDGFESLSAQIESQLWLLEVRSQFSDLAACLAGWCRSETLRELATGSLPES